MEISVTVNNGINNSSFLSPYDPSPYSLKSQSYDRNVDVIVTSESEDYLTVSEDEYSKTGRLADIPEVEANEVFATNSVRLAYQTPTIEEESTETDTDIVQSEDNTIIAKDNIEIVDLNKVNTSPYHIPRKKELPKDLSHRSKVPKIDLDSITNETDLSEITPLPRSDIDQISPRSPLPRSDIDQVSPRSPLPTSNIDQVSPRSPRSPPKTNLDLIKLSPKSPILKFNLDRTSPTSVRQLNFDKTPSPSRSPIPRSDLDNISVSSYSKRQQVPSDSEQQTLDLPYNYPQESVDDKIPVSDSEATRYNPLYEDSAASDFTDSETHDIYIASPRLTDRINKANTKDFAENSSDPENFDIAVPPPLEFSDNLGNKDNNPVTSIDDIETDNDVFESENQYNSQHIAPNQSYPFRQDNSRDLSYDTNAGEESDHHNFTETDDDAELAFNSELTAPFDIVLQEQGIYEQSNNYYHDLEEDTEDINEDILKVVKSYDDGTVVISQFEQPETIERDYNYPVHSVNRFSPRTREESPRMDNNSEEVLKNALDMEYDQLPETEKSKMILDIYTTDVQKGENGEIDFDNNVTTEQVVATNIAREIIYNEQGGGNGYYMESDDEPDSYPNEDMPEDAPDLPPELPPVLPPMPNTGPPELPNSPQPEFTGDITVSVVCNGTNIGDETTETTVVPENENWSFRAKPVDNNAQSDDDENDDVIVPVKVVRKTEIPIANDTSNQEEDEVIVAVSAKRDFRLPETFSDKMPSPRKTEEEDEPVEVTVKSTKSPPPVLPKPRRDEPVIEEETIVPADVNIDKAKQLVKVISVVKAMTLNARDKDPDVIDKIEREDAKDKPKSFHSAVIKVGGKSVNSEDNPEQKMTPSIEMSPPKHEQIVSDKDTIQVTKQVAPQISPPTQAIVEEVKDVIRKASPNKTVIQKEIKSDQGYVQPESDSTKPVFKTNISVEKPSIDVETRPVVESSPTKQLKETSEVVTIPVPPLNLESVSNAPNDSVSPKRDQSESYASDKSGEVSPPSKYKTTIGVPKPQVQKPISEDNKDLDKQVDEKVSNPKETEKRVLAPNPQIKPLSQIRPLSFNPKSLSQTSSRPVQYKTTISTLGIKPGLSLNKTIGAAQKADHPIKRMESMPFEVSILKGILGIGIKTTMTPEGYVKVTEILPNGPVGREGNIKVGDYILSINNTQLTGLTDGKVQQILRLLPRGLSKIVASAVPPDQCEETSTAEVPEKPKLASRQSLPSSGSEKSLSPRHTSPLSSPRQPTMITQSTTPSSPRPEPSTNKPTPTSSRQDSTTKPSFPRQTTVTVNPEASVLLTRQPVASPRSPTTVKSPVKVEPPKVAPKPAKKPMSASPMVSPRDSQGSSSSASPVASPRQQISPRTPPAVAPKPRKTNEAKVEPKKEDLTQPIEVEMFVSINANQQESAPSRINGNILPGSVNYDVVEPPTKSGWTAGMVSSLNLNNPVSNNEIIGNVDVVNDTNSLNVTDMSTEHSVEIKPESNEQNESNISESAKASEQLETKIEAKELEKEQVIDDVKVDTSILVEGNRSRTFSTSSTASSYTEFTECDVVEDESKPEQIAEEEEAPVSPVEKGEASKEVKAKEEATNNDDYESDFEDGDDIEPEQVESDSRLDMNSLKAMAENIVTGVIQSVKESDLLNASVNENDDDNENDDAPPVPTDCPPVPTSAPPPVPEELYPSTDMAPPPPLPASPPPVPESECPAPSVPESQLTEPTADADVGVAVSVVDLALYPDSDQSSEGMADKTDTAEVNEVIDVVDISVTSNLHAEAPVSNMSDISERANIDSYNVRINADTNSLIDHNIDMKSNDKTETVSDVDASLLPQVTDNTNGPEDNENVTTSNVNVDDSDEAAVSNVISMYSQLEKSFEENVDIVDGVNDVLQDDMNHSNNEANNNNIEKDSVEKSADVEIKAEVTCDISKVNNDSGKVDALPDSSIKVDSHCNDDDVFVNTVPNNVNGHSEIVDDRKDTKQRENSDDASSPRSASDSGSTGRKFSSRVEEILSHTEDIERGKYSPEVDKMIRTSGDTDKVFSTDEPEFEGEGELLYVTISKGVTGLGFIIQGGKGSIKGDQPITVKRIFKGGPADGKLQVRDEVLAVNDEDLSDMRHSEAWNHLKFLPSGDLVMKVRRFTSPDE